MYYLHRKHIDMFYLNIINCIQQVPHATGSKQCARYNTSIAGWNDNVSEKHDVAR